jgi:hypothetical protein
LKTTVPAESSGELELAILRFARPRIFADARFDEGGADWDELFEDIALLQGLVAGLIELGRREFREDELTEKLWLDLQTTAMEGLMLRSGQFTPAPGQSAGTWKVRKSGRGRRPEGEWRFCARCGQPMWLRPSFIAKGYKYCSHECDSSRRKETRGVQAGQ